MVDKIFSSIITSGSTYSSTIKTSASFSSTIKTNQIYASTLPSSYANLNIPIARGHMIEGGTLGIPSFTINEVVNLTEHINGYISASGVNTSISYSVNLGTETLIGKAKIKVTIAQSYINNSTEYISGSARPSLKIKGVLAQGTLTESGSVTTQVTRYTLLSDLDSYYLTSLDSHTLVYLDTSGSVV